MKINLRIFRFLAGVLLIVSNSCALAHTDVTTEQARNLIAATNNLIVVDVREPYEYCDTRGHIPGALNYPWSSGVLQARYEELPTDGPVLVVCRSGGRSNAAANFLDSKGLATVYDMLGGMSAWQWETAPCKYSGGSGTAEDPYQIATTGDLIALGETPEDYDKHFILTADIDLDPNLPSRKVFDRAVIAQDANDASSRFEGTPFTGVFDGYGHTISHLTITGGWYLGLFGKLDSGSKISNLDLEAVDVNGTGHYIGGLVGIIGSLKDQDAVLTNCYSAGKVTGTEKVGGLVGDNFGSIITSYSTCEVRGERIVGGLMGGNGVSDLSFGGILINSYSAGMTSGESRVGGMVGVNGGIITTSYSTGRVNGTGTGVGGLVGNDYGIITTSYSTGEVTGNRFVGGLVGMSYGHIAASYSTGTVSGNEDVGGLAGNNFYSIITTSFWDIESSGQATSAGGTGLTTAEMQEMDTYINAGWDFVDEIFNGTCDYWQISPGDYPRLRYQVRRDRERPRNHI
jgi:rhodanese-related sulfurtransferase